jgi:uncharacterized membrane protein YeiH
MAIEYFIEIKDWVIPENMMSRDVFAIPMYIEYVATFTWAMSGAIVGVRRRYDIVGVFVIALFSSMGGGLIRDGVMLQRTPVMLTNGMYLLIIVIATIIVGLVARKVISLPKSFSITKLVEVIDVLGIPAYAVVGMLLSLDQSMSLPGVVLVGVVNGVGGGLLRDVITGEEPALLKPGQFTPLVVLLVCVVFVALTEWIVIPIYPAALFTIALFFIIRVLIIRFNWRTEALVPHDSA